jgi:class 3 adenylate cyclase
MAVCLDNYPERMLELACELHLSYGKNNKQLRIGICSGIAFDIKDINRRPNLAGSGLNLAQRILNCCSPGHILVASMLGGDLGEMKQWHNKLHGPYQFKVKHDQRLAAFNFYDVARGVGNKKEPTENRVPDEKN